MATSQDGSTPPVRSAADATAKGKSPVTDGLVPSTADLLARRDELMHRLDAMRPTSDYMDTFREVVAAEIAVVNSLARAACASESATGGES